MFEIEKYEAMAMFDLDENEREKLRVQCESLTESFKAIDTIDTENVKPMVSVIDATNILRDDVATQFITRDELLSNAPEQHDGYFQVPETL